MAFKMKNKELKKIIGELKNASKLHAGQAEKLEDMSSSSGSPLKKISAACKAAAKRKFKVWPSAYASGWGVRCTKAGGPGKMGKGKKKSSLKVGPRGQGGIYNPRTQLDLYKKGITVAGTKPTAKETSTTTETTEVKKDA
tara:strand:- start:292 stop:711 length:420 start_codon:yes stop_codon:yes gene_type:complete